jgi:hypothetical protein
MTAQWHFNQPKPGDKNREPVLGEFFATEALRLSIANSERKTRPQTDLRQSTS